MGQAIVIPWGLWIYNAIVFFQPLIISAAGILLPIIVTNGLVRFFAGQTILNAINYGLATTENAVKGQTMSIETSNAVLNNSLTWLVENEPKAAAFYGPKLRDYLIAELSKMGSAPVKAIKKV